MELDPRNATTPTNIAVVLTRMRRYQEAETYYDQALRLAPDQVYIYGMKSLNTLFWKGDLKGVSKHSGTYA